MKFRKVINKRFGKDRDGVQVAGGVNAALDVNVGEGGKQHTRTSSRTRIVQRSGTTTIEDLPTDDSETEGDKPGKEHG